MFRLLKFMSLSLILLCSLVLAQDKPPMPLKPSPEVSIYTEQGGDALDASDFILAAKSYQKALEIAQQRNDVQGEAISLIGLAIAVSERGQAQLSLEYAQRALILFHQTGDKQAESKALNVIAIVYQGIAQYPQALQYYERAVPLAKQSGDAFLEATLINNIGTLYGKLGDTTKALEYLQKALPLQKKLGDKVNIARVLAGIASTYGTMQQPAKALEFYFQALPLLKEVQNKNLEGSTLSNIGVAYRDMDQPQKALEYYQQAGALFQQTGDTDRQAGVFYNIGSIYSSLGDYNQAELSLNQSLTLREQVRGNIGGNAENRQVYLTSVLPTYSRLVFAQNKLGHGDRAFATLNKMKGRSLLEQAGRRASLAGIPDEAQVKLRELRKENDRLSVMLAATSPRNTLQHNAIRTQLEAAEQSVRLEQDRLFSLYQGAAQRNVARTATLDDIPAFLPPDTALLEFVILTAALGKQKLDQVLVYVATVDAGKPSVTVHSLAMNSDEIVDDAEQLREACASPKHAYKSLARKLASLLLPPDVLQRLANKNRLIVCPDRAIWEVPFAALVLPDGKHLIEHFEIDYAYSATGTQAALTVSHTQAEGMLVVANPDFGDTSRFGTSLPKQVAEGKERPISDPARPISDPARPLFEPSRLASILERGKIKPLPGTQQEADALAHLYPNAVLLTGKTAQEGELVKALPKYRYLHFATHGLFSDTAPLQSAIVLAQPPKDSADDGFLTAREIFEMPLNAEMAVLSACETARGVNTEGEGVVGLTWALFAAGVPTQVVSQWKVSDASTPQLMTAFYSNLKSGQGKGRALQNAARAMMYDGKHRHPYHWAAFVLFGDWR